MVSNTSQRSTENKVSLINFISLRVPGIRAISLALQTHLRTMYYRQVIREVIKTFKSFKML